MRIPLWTAADSGCTAWVHSMIVNKNRLGHNWKISNFRQLYRSLNIDNYLRKSNKILKQTFWETSPTAPHKGLSSGRLVLKRKKYLSKGIVIKEQCILCLLPAP